MAFRLKYYLENQIIIIQWLTNYSIAKMSENKIILYKEDIKTRIELIHMGIVELEVNINLIKPCVVLVLRIYSKT